MSFWKAIGLGGGKELNYDIGDPIDIPDEYKYRINWTMFKGTSKVDKSEATVFKFEIKPNSATEAIDLCKNCVRRARTLMLPNVLKYIDGLETPQAIFIVTEPVRPLCSVLQEMEAEGNGLSREFISWGLYCVMQGLEHIHMGGKVHGNFGLHSIYVNKCGDWKLFGLDWCSPLDTPLVTMTDGKMEINHFKQHHAFIPTELKAPELLKGNFSLIEASPVYAVDAWASGLLFYEIFNGQITTATTPADLKNPGNMPRPLFGAFMGLISHTAKLRMNPAKLLVEGGNDYFSGNEYIGVQLQLENMALILKDHLEMETFFRKLEHMVADFPKMNCKYKILPKISEATQFGSGGTAALTTILKLAEQLTTEEYQSLVIPGLIALYKSHDPNVRIKLLQSVPLYVAHVKEPVISQLWEQLCTGFSSQFAEIRELTIKALVHLVAHLPERIVSTEVMKQIWQMQTDKEGGIRTNAVICLGKIAPMLSHSVREKMLLPSFQRSLKDPFHHSRIACCNSFVATAEFYSDQILAGQVLPAVSPLCADSVKEVRQAALKCCSALLSRLQKMSDGVIDTAGVTESRKPTAQEESGYLSWAMSSIKTKLYGEEDNKHGKGSQGHAPRPQSTAASGTTSTTGSGAVAAAATAEQGYEQQYSAEDYQNYDPNYDPSAYDANLYYGYTEEEYYNSAAGDAMVAAEGENAWNDNLSDFGNAEAAPAPAEPAAGDGWGNDDKWSDDDEPKPVPKATTPKVTPVKKTLSKSLSSTGSPTTEGGEKKAGGMELKKKPVKKSLGAKKMAAD
mmetsp:Transcript_10396/g.18335  ORF Transcript_10396/g.18335 Transcript_10396/m.18335 type:complete len:792 (-) Transcript_10396:857-3232(-)